MTSIWHITFATPTARQLWKWSSGERRRAANHPEMKPRARPYSIVPSDSDGSPEGEDALAASFTTARAEGIAQPPSDTPGEQSG